MTKCTEQAKARCVVQYPGCAVYSVRIFLLAGGQSDVGDRLHRIGQGQQHLALLNTQNRGHMFNLDPDGFKADIAGIADLLTPPPKHVGSKHHMKDEVRLRKQWKEHIPLILRGAFTGLRKEALKNEAGYFCASTFNSKLDLSTFCRVNSSSPSEAV